MRDTADERRSRAQRERHPDHCANCGITLDGDDDRTDAGERSSTSSRAGNVFCCDGCADGGPCVC